MELLKHKYRGAHGNQRFWRLCKTNRPRSIRNGRWIKNPMRLRMWSVKYILESLAGAFGTPTLTEVNDWIAQKSESIYDMSGIE